MSWLTEEPSQKTRRRAKGMSLLIDHLVLVGWYEMKGWDYRPVVQERFISRVVGGGRDDKVVILGR